MGGLRGRNEEQQNVSIHSLSTTLDPLHAVHHFCTYQTHPTHVTSNNLQDRRNPHSHLCKLQQCPRITLPFFFGSLLFKLMHKSTVKDPEKYPHTRRGCC